MNNTKRALITGINGQDGSYMADLLLSKEYKVYGLERRTATKHRQNVKGIQDRIVWLEGDLTDMASLTNALIDSRPHEIYNFAAQSFVGSSFSQPVSTAQITAVGVLNLLEAVRSYTRLDNSNSTVKVFQAGSSEMFGKVTEVPQNETTRFYPRSPYAAAKVYAHWIAKNYREAYNMFIVNAICFNHESERRGYEFVTRKITDGVARIFLQLDNEIVLGNLDAERDWGYAPDYMEAIWKMMQQDEPDDYVLATGVKHSVRDFLTTAFKVIGIEDWSNYVKLSKEFERPTEVDELLGDPSKARKKLDWKPKTPFEELVKKMVAFDIQ